MEIEELHKKIEEQDKILKEIYTSVEKTRRYFQIMLWATVITFVLPLIAIMFIAPMVFNTYLDTLNSIV